MRRWLPLVLLLLCFPVLGQQADPRAKLLQDALDALESTPDSLAPELKNTYQEALLHLRSLEKAQRESETWRQLLEDSADVIGSLEKEIETFPSTPLPDLSDRSLDELKQQQSQLTPQLLDLEGTLNVQENQLNKLRSRRQQLPALITALRDSLQQVQLLPPTAQDKRLQQALQLRNEYQREALNEQIEALSLEQLVLPSRQQQVELNTQLTKLRLSDLRDLVKHIRDTVYQKRKARARQTLGELEQLEELLVGRPALLQREAAENEQLLLILDSLIRQQESQGNLNEQVKQKDEQLVDRVRLIRTERTWLSRSPKYGASLRLNLENLPLIPSQQDLEDALAERHIQCYDYRLVREKLQPVQAAFQRLVTSSEESLSRVDQDLLLRLLRQRESLLLNIEARCESLIRIETALQASYQQLDNTLQLLRSTIRKQLLWAPHLPPMDRQFLGELLADIEVLWNRIRSTQWRDITAIPRATVPGLLLFLLVVVKYWEHALWHRLRDNYARRIGNVTQDSFPLTLRVLLTEMLLALPLPLLVSVTGWWLGAAPRDSLFNDLARALLVVGFYLYPFLLVAKWASPNGLLAVHLDLDRTSIKLVRSSANKLAVFGGLLLFVIVLSIEEADLAVPQNLGRVALIMLGLLYTYLQLRVLYRSPLRPLPRTTTQTWAATIVLSLFTLLLALLAIRGYMFAATQLGLLYIISLVVWSGMRIGYLLILRFLLIQERRLAYQRAKSRRDERRVQREGSAVGSLRPQSEGDRSTVAQLSTQSLRLLQPLWILVFALILLTIWTERLNATDLLGNIRLWQSLDASGQATFVTLDNLVEALIIAGLTWIGSRNLPALMELSVLPRFALLPGTGYALMTLLRYGLILLGTIVTFSLLGFQWNKLQWLVAAVGVGLGFGLQEIFGNLVSGLILLFEKPIRIGDTVTIQDVTGTITRIQIRATTIQDYDRREVILPNKSFITEKLINWSLSDRVGRVVIPLSFEHQADPKLIEAALYQAIAQTPLILDPPSPRVLFLGINQQGMEFKIYCFLDDIGDSLSVKDQLYHAIHQAMIDKDLPLARPKMEFQFLDQPPAT